MGPAASPAGLPRVLTVPLPCACSPLAASAAAGLLRLVSRETAADNACFTRAGGSSRCTAPESRPRPHTSSGTRPCCTTPVAPGNTPGAAPAPVSCAPVVSPSGPATAPRAGADHHLARPCCCGQPRPFAASRDSSQADARGNPVGSSGHPTPSREAIAALLFVKPGRPRRLIDPPSAGPLLQPDRPYRSRRGEPPRVAHPAGPVRHARPVPPRQPSPP